MRYRYWDACCFIGWLKAEPDKVPECRTVIGSAERGELKIVTSSLTLAEVLRLKGKDPIPAADAHKVRGFFRNPYIVLYDLDRTIAESAQDVVWNQGVKPKDAVHVATALAASGVAGIEQLDTFDGNLIALSGQMGNPPLVIGRPNLPEQLTLNS